MQRMEYIIHNTVEFYVLLNSSRERERREEVKEVGVFTWAFFSFFFFFNNRIEEVEVEVRKVEGRFAKKKFARICIQKTNVSCFATAVF